MFCVIILVFSLTSIESPRHLVRTGRREKALENLSKLRGMQPTDPYVVGELAGIEAQHHEEMEATYGLGWLGIAKEVFTVRSNWYRLVLTNSAQILANFSGGGAITVYAPDLFTIVGITGEEQSLLSTAIFGVVKFVASVICALFLVDTLGRKRALVIGITLQTFAMLYVAIFLDLVPIANNQGFQASPSQNRASEAAIAMIYISGTGWALGWNSGQYLLSSELFPLRIRAICSSITMGMHFVGQYAVTKALPSMLLVHQGLSPHGSFYFFAAVGALGAAWVWLCVPEAAGRSLESIDRLFDLPWYRIGLHGKAYAEAHDREMEGLREEALRQDKEAVVTCDERA